MNTDSKVKFNIQNIFLNSFEICAYRHRSENTSNKSTVDSHFHNKCEIYVNISGDVSFMVENRIYSIQSGDAIITRPYENHHCIDHASKPHDHFCISFSPEGNEEIFDVFFNRNPGENNLLVLPAVGKEKLIQLCHRLTESESNRKRCAAFFSVIDLISDETFSDANSELPEDLKTAVTYINNNFQNPLNVEEIAKLSNVTVNTLERHFKAYIGISPYAYIQNYRLANARAMLENGETVTQTALDSGFSDYSHFIASFKKRYGKTPLRFKQGLSRSLNDRH